MTHVNANLLMSFAKGGINKCRLSTSLTCLAFPCQAIGAGGDYAHHVHIKKRDERLCTPMYAHANPSSTFCHVKLGEIPSSAGASELNSVSALYNLNYSATVLL